MHVVVDEHARQADAAACDIALLAVLDALACAFKAVQEPTCARLLGALVPGATMAFGARVPGTSFQLDPVQAAFNIGTMTSWLGTNDPVLESACGHVADPLGAILAVADYRSRKAIAEGATAPTVRDVLTTLVCANACAAFEWSRGSHDDDPSASVRAPGVAANDPARCAVVTIAAASAAAALLGGTTEQIAAAVALARRESPFRSHASTAESVAAESVDRWRVGDANARGVRLALIALAQPGHSAPTPTPAGCGATFPLEAAAQSTLAAHPGAAGSDLSARIRDRFHASVTAHFPTVQAGKICALAADTNKLMGLPISEFVSSLVRN